MPINPNADFLRFTHRLADASGEVVRRWFKENMKVETKLDATPVTLADTEVETIIRSMIEAEFPDHGIVGEEFGNIREDAPYQWVIDPIDGTKAFIAGAPSFTTLIALYHKDTPILGMIDQPILRERFVGLRGEPENYSYNMKTLKQANIATTSDGYFTPQQEILFTNLKKATASTTLGGDAYAYALITKGKLDVVVDAGMKTHDFCALVCVIEQAGGVITDWYGKPLTLKSDGTVLATASPALHAEALKILMGA